MERGEELMIFEWLYEHWPVNFCILALKIFQFDI